METLITSFFNLVKNLRFGLDINEMNLFDRLNTKHNSQPVY